MDFLRAHELGHFALEESELLPLVPDEPEAQTMAARVRSDHRFLSAALREMERTGPPALDTLHAVGDRLDQHVRLEEQQLFPYLERVLAPEVLEAVGKRLSG